MAIVELPRYDGHLVIHHSDRGSQYTSLAFGERCREAGVVQSKGPVGDVYDNASVRASSRRWSVNSSTSDGSRRRSRPGVKSSASSRASTTPAGSTPRSDITRRPTSRRSTMRPEANMVRRPGGATAANIGRATGIELRRPRGRADLPAGCRASLVHPRSDAGRPAVRTRVRFHSPSPHGRQTTSDTINPKTVRESGAGPLEHDLSQSAFYRAFRQHSVRPVHHAPVA